MLIHTDYDEYIVAENVFGVGVQPDDNGEFNVVLYGGDGGRDGGRVLTACKEKADAEEIKFRIAHLMDRARGEGDIVIGRNQFSKDGFEEAIRLLRDKKVRRAQA